MEANRLTICKRCGGPTGPGDDVTNQSPSDPIVVSECARCSSIVDIGGHRW